MERVRWRVKETEFSGARLACDLVLMCEIVSQTVFSRTRFLIDLVFFCIDPMWQPSQKNVCKELVQNNLAWLNHLWMDRRC